MKLLENKVAFITGASRGIGRSIALKFASEGADIAFTATSESEDFRKTRLELQDLGVRVKGYVFDASDFDAAQQAIQDAVTTFSKIDILVNNAGITRDNLLLRMTEKEWDEVLNVNLKSAFNCTHAVLPTMMKQRKGSIINLSSVVGIDGNAGQCNYAASKAGLVGLTKSIAKEMGSRNIRANAIAPGLILTDMTKRMTEEKRQEVAAMIPLKRIGTTDDVAAAALFLASDMSSYITGQVLQVDGGM